MIHIESIKEMFLTWKCLCEKNEDVSRVYIQVKELADMMDIYVDGLLIGGIK